MAFLSVRSYFCFFVFGVPNAKYLAFGTPKKNALPTIHFIPSKKKNFIP